MYVHIHVHCTSSFLPYVHVHVSLMYNLYMYTAVLGAVPISSSDDSSQPQEKGSIGNYYICTVYVHYSSVYVLADSLYRKENPC